MSENNKNKEFQFIQEQVIEKKFRKLRKRIFRLFRMMVTSIIMGLIVACTFVLVEPRLYKLLKREDEPKTPVTFPTLQPEEMDEGTPKDEVTPVITPPVEQKEPTVVEKTIDADIRDFAKMYDDIKRVSSKANRSILKLSAETDGTDWIGNPIQQSVETSGVVISDLNDRYLILASYDRIKDANQVKIVFESRNEVPVVIHDYEEELNLVVLSVDQDQIPEYLRNMIQVMNFSQSSSLTAGTPVIALGNPNGYLESMDIGIVTHRGNAISVLDNRLDIFYTSMNTNERSDGIIINLNGDMVGIMTRTLKQDKDKSLSSVLGISKLDRVIEKMANQEPRIYFGIRAEDMTPGVKSAHGVTNGIFVNEVEPDSPAFQAGIKTGDIILQVNEKDIVTTNGFNSMISEYKASDEVTVKVKRMSGAAEKEDNFKVVLKYKNQS